MTNAVLAQPMEELWFAPEQEQAVSGFSDQFQGWRSDFSGGRDRAKPTVASNGFPQYSGVTLEIVEPVALQAEFTSNQALIFGQTRWGFEEELTDFALESVRLEKAYMYAKEEAVNQFLSRHRTVAGLLLEGASALKASFGDDALLRLQVLPGDEAAGSIYALVAWTGSASDARGALAKFDETWWTENADRVAGRITFDYRLV